MALVINDRVKETSTTTGTGTFSLAGAVTGFETFSSAIGNANTTYYAIVNSNGEFEVGLGTVGAATLARTTIISSSNSDSAVNFAAGTKDVFVTLPASKAVIEDASSNVTLPADLSVGDDLTVLGGVIDFKSNSGSPAALRMYCEVSNAHYQTLLPQPHSAAAGNSLRLPDSGDTGTQDLVAVNISQTLTNKTLTSPVLNSTISGTSIKDEDDMSSNSATHLATQQSIKAYVDTEVASVPVGDITSVVAGTNLSGGGTSGDVTLNLADASTSAKGAASFSSDNFAASSGAITIKDAGVATAELQDDAVTTVKITDANVTTAKIADVNVTEGKIADNAVTLAKMASGTDGNIISYDASGNPVAIATGSSGQVLTSAGAGAQPSFQTPTVGDITSVVAGTNLSGGGTSGDVTLNLADASTSAKGAASFSSDNFAASSGAITIKDLGVATAEIQNDAVTQAKIGDDAVGADQLASDAVVTASIVDVNVTTGKIADDAITLAKMASGTDGNLITYDTSGNPAAVATGSSGQVLTSAGAGAVPSFQTIAAAAITSTANGANNRVATYSDSDSLNGEANMTFDGSTLVIAGAITATGDITAFQSSDKNLKENISNIENAVDKVSKINGVYYNWTSEAQEKNDHFGKEKEVGVIAQDVEEVLPEIVATRDDGTKAVKYERLCALLIESVKELKKEIEELKSGA